MRMLIQRVSKASVFVDNQIVGSIEAGLLVFLAVAKEDSKQAAIYLVDKLLHLRIFKDEEQKFNRSVLDAGGSVLVVSQFTLYGNCLEGRRPSFEEAAPPILAKELYDFFVEELASKRLFVQTGVFGATMSVSLVNEGPATFLIEKSFKQA